jgi:lipopolysaccharide transport system permease protein
MTDMADSVGLDHRIGGALSGDDARPADLGEPELVIEPRTGWVPVDWREVWRHRELLWFFVWRDLKVRYKQTVLGVAWAVLQPLFSMVVCTIIFGHIAKLASDGFPYAVFVFAGLLPWTFFSAAVTAAGQSVVSQQHLFTKVYFPRLFVPTACVGSSSVDLLVSFGVYGVILGVYHVVPSWQVVFLPGLIALTFLATLGLGYTLAALTVTYRDFRFVVPFLLQVLFYLSPVVYSMSMVGPKYRWLLALNPVTGLVEGYRSAILGKAWNFTALAISSACAGAWFVFGLFFFRRTERQFADVA